MTNEQKERVRLLVKELRTTTAGQVRRSLRGFAEDAAGESEKEVAGYCCLGIACNVFQQENGGKWNGTYFFPTDEDRSNCQHGYLPDSVRDWFGFELSDPVIRIDHDEYGDEPCTASQINDEYGATFAEIADLFEAMYLK